MKIRFFDIAKRLSLKSDYKFKLGAVIVNKRGMPVGFGYNTNKTHTRSNTPFKTVHAELSAILDCNRQDLDGAEVYVYRQLKNGSPALAKPCQHCMELLKLANVSRVYYTSEKGFESHELASHI